MTSLIGINGAGKTTLLKSIMGLTPINSGKILINGEKRDKTSYEKMSFVPDALIFPQKMKIREALQFRMDFYKSWNANRAAELKSSTKGEGGTLMIKNAKTGDTLYQGNIVLPSKFKGELQLQDLDIQ